MTSKSVAKRVSELKKPRPRTFQVIVTCRVELELDQSVIDAVDDSWRKQFYGNIRTPKDIAELIGMNMARHETSLDFIDGFANLPRSAARVTDEEWDVEAKETTVVLGTKKPT